MAVGKLRSIVDDCVLAAQDFPLLHPPLSRSEQAATPRQRIVLGVLSDIADAKRRHEINAPRARRILYTLLHIYAARLIEMPDPDGVLAVIDVRQNNDVSRQPPSHSDACLGDARALAMSFTTAALTRHQTISLFRRQTACRRPAHRTRVARSRAEEPVAIRRTRSQMPPRDLHAPSPQSRWKSTR